MKNMFKKSRKVQNKVWLFLKKNFKLMGKFVKRFIEWITLLLSALTLRIINTSAHAKIPRKIHERRSDVRRDVATLSATKRHGQCSFYYEVRRRRNGRLLFASRCHIPLASLPVTDSAQLRSRSRSLSLSLSSALSHSLSLAQPPGG